MQGGDLRTALHRERKEGKHDLDWYNKGKEVALAVAQGLHFLHTSGVIHRCGYCPHGTRVLHGSCAAFNVSPTFPMMCSVPGRNVVRHISIRNAR